MIVAYDGLRPLADRLGAPVARFRNLVAGLEAGEDLRDRLRETYPAGSLRCDTNVLVAAIRSRRGASFKLLSMVGRDRFEISLSVPLVLEYEDALGRHLAESPLQEQDVRELLDFLCAVAHRQQIFFLWRPYLRDPKDDMILELGVASRCKAIVTHNVQDFGDLSRFGLQVFTPRDFLVHLGELP